MLSFHILHLAQGSPIDEASALSDEASNNDLYDLVIVLTIWKRDTLDQYLDMLAKQTALQRQNFRTNIIMFQNGDYLNVTATVNMWSDKKRWNPANVTLTYIHSFRQTDYYGRFLAPLLSRVREDGYFVIFDDNVIFGTRYILRVVDSGRGTWPCAFVAL